MKHEYRDLMDSIQVPQGLNERVLAAARQEPVRGKRRQPMIWRTAVCAVLALALVAGGVSLRHGGEPLQADGEFFVGLTAHASDLPAAVNSGIVFNWEEDKGSFQVAGSGIALVSLETDQGILLQNGEQMGQKLRAAFDAETVYALIPEVGETLESLDGATLTLRADYENGEGQTEIYDLTRETMRTSQNETGETVLVPALAYDQEGVVTALYCAPRKACWLNWPVEGSHTVSLSNRYGFRAAPDGEGGTFHAGIDIPAEQGSRVLAAAGGTVTEAGFDPDRGNYLVLDHGDGMETVYAHCLSLAVETGDTVESGQVIAAVGSTGKSTGPHLCFQVWREGEAQNPVAYFDAEIRDTLKMG